MMLGDAFFVELAGYVQMLTLRGGRRSIIKKGGGGTYSYFLGAQEL